LPNLANCYEVAGQWRRLRASNPFAANTVATAAANLVIAGFGLLTGIATARLLGPQGRGELAAIQVTPSFIAMLAMLGLPEALTYYSAQDPGRGGHYLGTASALALAASIVFVAGGCVIMPSLLHAQDAGIINAARWYLLIAPIWALQGMLPPLLRGIGDFALWNLMRLMVPVCAVAVLLIAWLTGEETARFIAFGNLAFNLLLFVPFLCLAGRRIKGSYSPERALIRQMLEYGLPCAITVVPQTLNLRLDQMLMAALMPPRELGLYVVAVAWSAAVSPLLTSIGAAILPSVAGAPNHELAVARLSQGARAACAVALSVCTAVMMVTPMALVYLFGANFRGSIPAALVLVPAAGVLGINLALQESIRGLGFPYTVLRAELFGLAVSGALLAVSLRPFGIMGAAVSSLLGYAAVMAALLASAKRLAGLSARELLCPSTRDFRIGLERAGAIARRLVVI
jgi:O-antigen/teichoic acid export membrane protein